MTGEVGVDRFAGPGVLGIRLREAARPARQIPQIPLRPGREAHRAEGLLYSAAPQSKGGRPFGKPPEVISS